MTTMQERLLASKMQSLPMRCFFYFILLQIFKKTKKKSLKILWLTKHETYLVPFSSGKKTDKQEKVVSSSTPTRKQTQNQLTKKEKKKHYKEIKQDNKNKYTEEFKKEKRKKHASTCCNHYIH